MNARRFKFAVLAVVAAAAVACALPMRAFNALPPAPRLEAGTAITAPATLRALEVVGFSLPVLAGGATDRDNPLFSGPLAPIGETLLADIEAAPRETLDSEARRIFQDPAFARLKFSAFLLRHPRSHFELVGVVNRMDRAYRTVGGRAGLETCGEVRFIYRFRYHVETSDGRAVSSRLPFTASVVLRAKSADDPTSCAEIARRWLALADLSDAEADSLALDLTQGPLHGLSSALLDRIEINLQLFRLPAGARPDFGGHAEYLLRVFRRQPPAAPFAIAPLENQIDRARLLQNPALMRSFQDWLFATDAIESLDRGEIDIPSIYLATKAVSASPGGVSRSQNQAFSGLLSPEDIAAALARRRQQGEPRLRTIRSTDAFVRRLNESACTGCHQTQAIAGFHMPGESDEATETGNSIVLAGSAHFYGDQPRRRAVLVALAEGRTPDFSRSFSDRPDRRHRSALRQTELVDGAGATCYVGDDPSFANWSCRTGFRCRVLYAAEGNDGMGECVAARRPRVGDPMEFGRITQRAYGDDVYTRTSPTGSTQPDNYDLPAAPRNRTDYRIATQGSRGLAGGFPGGMLFINNCDRLPARAGCGRLAARGFNACVLAGRPFQDCMAYTEPAGLPACNRAAPCRQDYACATSYNGAPRLARSHSEGVCVPPYFLFQFRADGHPDQVIAH